MKKETITASRYTTFRSRFYPLLWFLAAVDEEDIRQCHSSEQDKQAVVGILIIITTMWAMVSAYFAISSIFASQAVSIFASLFWGVTIFNIDRLMVGSIRKGPATTMGKLIRMAMPRIILAGFIAFLISKPFEVKIFHAQIDSKREVMNRESLDSALLPFNKDVDKATSGRSQSQTELEEINKRIDRAEDYAPYAMLKSSWNECKATAAGLEGDIREINIKKAAVRNNPANFDINDEQRPILNEDGDRMIADLNVEQARLKQELSQLNCQALFDSMNVVRNGYLSRLQSMAAKKDAEIAEKIVAQKRFDSTKIKAEVVNKPLIDASSTNIMGELHVLSRLTSDEPTYLIASLLIMALFFLLETAPVFVKIFSPRGKYDTLQFMKDQRAFDDEEANIKESEMDKRVRIESLAQKKADAQAMEEETTKAVHGQIKQAQVKISEQIIKNWQSRQEDMLKQDPEKYLNGN